MAVLGSMEYDENLLTLSKKTLQLASAFLEEPENRELLDSNQIDELFTNCWQIDFDHFSFNEDDIGLSIVPALVLADIDFLPHQKKLVVNEFGLVPLISIKIPSNIEEIDQYAFSHCYTLEKVFIPKSVKRIEDYVFEQCEGLTEIVYEGTAEQFLNIVSKHWLGSDVLELNEVKCSDKPVNIWAPNGECYWD